MPTTIIKMPPPPHFPYRLFDNIDRSKPKANLLNYCHPKDSFKIAYYSNAYRNFWTMCIDLICYHMILPINIWLICFMAENRGSSTCTWPNLPSSHLSPVQGPTKCGSTVAPRGCSLRILDAAKRGKWKKKREREIDRQTDRERDRQRGWWMHPP